MYICPKRHLFVFISHEKNGAGNVKIDSDHGAKGVFSISLEYSFISSEIYLLSVD